jgi:hypothetical protein
MRAKKKKNRQKTKGREQRNKIPRQRIHMGLNFDAVMMKEEQIGEGKNITNDITESPDASKLGYPHMDDQSGISIGQQMGLYQSNCDDPHG